MAAVEGEEDAVGEDPVALAGHKVDIGILLAPVGQSSSQRHLKCVLCDFNFV